MRRLILITAAAHLPILVWPIAGIVGYITSRHTISQQRHSALAAIAETTRCAT